MQEMLDQVFDIVRGLWRFRWIALLSAWGLCLIGWFFVLALPNIYEAEAKIYVDPRTALKPVIQGIAIEQDVNSEINYVRQALLGQVHLKKILDDTGISAQAVTPQQQALAMDELRERISIDAVAPTSTSADSSQVLSRVYSIDYKDSDQQRSLRVVKILVDSFMEQTLGGKRQGSIDAQKFVEEQIKEYEKRLSEAEQRLANFKKRYVGMVPGEQQSDYFTRLQNEMDAVKKAQSDLGIATTRREALSRQLRGEAPIAAAAGMPAMPGVAGGAQGGGGDTLSRIKETQARLDDLLLRYTDQHPDVIAMRETLTELKQRRTAELEALKKGDAGAAALTGASANPVYQSIQLALNQSDVEIAGLRGELSAHQQKVSELRQLLDTMPQVEAEYAQLNRDYTVMKEQYTALVDRLGKARLGEEAEAVGSIRFEVINPPAVSFQPVAPRRPLLLLGVLAVSLAVGAGIAFLLNLLKPVFNSVRSLAEATGATVLGVVSVVRTPAEATRRVWGYVTYSLACAGLLVGLVLAVIAGRLFAPVGNLLHVL